MSASFVSQLRSRRQAIELVPPGPDAISVRVEMPEVWDTVRVVTRPDEPMMTIKQRAIEALFPEAQFHDDFVLKLRGWEILDEQSPLSEVGIVDGSILLLTHRRRRPVR